MTNSALAEALAKAEALGVSKQRAQSTREIKQALDASDVAHLGEIQRLKESAIDGQKAAHAHGFHKAAWMFSLGGFLVGLAASLITVAFVLGAGTEATVRGAAVGSQIRATDDLRRDMDAAERGEWPRSPLDGE